MERRAIAWLAIAVAFPLLACGPWFPNRLLDRGDEAVLQAPYADFEREIRRLELVAATLVAKPPTNQQSHALQTAQADVDDLRAALRKSSLSPAERVAVIKYYEDERERLLPKEAHAAKESGDETAHQPDDSPADTSSSVTPALGARAAGQSETAKPPGGLPGEFTDYLRGAQAWARQDTNAAVAAWQALLERPAKERAFKSTWAAFMLGKAWLATRPDEASASFQKVRAFAHEGLGDSLGLAASSLGWEAKIHYDQGQWLAATGLYLEQAASGDPSATISLLWTAAKVMTQGDEVLAEFARHPKAQRVITAYLLRDHLWGTVPVEEEPSRSAAVRWLGAVEAAGVKEVAAAEQLALLAYRHGAPDQARRWLKLAKDTPVSLWLQAKLLLRDGKVAAAGDLLARVARAFPLAPVEELKGRKASFQASLYLSAGGGEVRSAAQELWGELGAIRLARREYEESLEALLRAGFWDDAAYVAERVLTLDELKAFVDRRWADDPELRPLPIDAEASEAAREYHERLAQTRGKLRHLLARRLTRESRGSEARTYFPPEQQAHLDAFVRALDAAYEESRPAAERAQSFMATARLARHHGMEILATELEPDFAIYDGQFEGNISPADRLPVRRQTGADGRDQETRQVLYASADEARRTAGPPADPPVRFHYRYIAANLGWLGAQLLPDHTDEKARILCEAGTWLKGRDPEAADRYYKELVRKCRRTEIGKLADEIRWFPLLDEQGNLLPVQPRSRGMAPVAQPAEPVVPPAEEPAGPLEDL